MTIFPTTLAEVRSFSPVERLAFLALATASATLFWLGFRKILARILQARPDAGFSLHPLAPRIRGFVWEVLCQAKVVRQRPLPGLAHAALFWAFCIFALVTLNHCAAALGLAFLDPANGLGRVYSSVAAVLAVACALGILGLTVRRFLLRPKWLGEKPSWESGAIALLIFALMATYLGGFFVVDFSPEARALWWLHTLALLVFLPLVPRTKHLHLLLGPVSVFLSRGGVGRIPPLAGEEDFGLVAASDLTRLIALQAYSCVECGRCTEHCPATATGKLLNPKEIVLGLRDCLNEQGPASEAPLLGKYVPAEAPFQCTTCGACEFQCPVGIEHLPILVGLRRGAVNTGTWENEYGTKLFLNLERTGNPLGIGSAARDRFIKEQELPLFYGSQEYCLWLGCMGSYDPSGRRIVAALAQTMRYLGASYGVLRQERCTGDSARRLGNDLLFQQLAEANLEAMKQAGVKRIVSICPHCVRTIEEDWKEFGTPPQVEHHSEFLARFAGKLPKRASDDKIVFHDPCYLGRHRNVYEEPRAVAALAGELVEVSRSRERGFCCGAGGGLAFLGEETGERIGQHRAAELAASGAATVATACPFCNTMLRDALTARESPPQLLDIAQLAALGIPGDATTHEGR
jgi:Fe-S oxidoreductase